MKDLFDKYMIIAVRRVMGDSTSVAKILDFGIDNPQTILVVNRLI